MIAKELFFFFGAIPRAHTVVLPLETMPKVLTMARGGMEAFAHVVEWSALVVAKKGCMFFSWVRVVNDKAEAIVKSPTRQIDKNLTSTFQLAIVERVLGALTNGIGLCGEEEAVVVVLSSGVVTVVGAELATIGQQAKAFGWKNSCVCLVWVAVVVRW